MGILTHLLSQGVRTLVTVTTGYGEQQYSSGVNELCRFREITGLMKNNNQELIDADAMSWHEPTSTIQEGSIIRVENNFYRVEKRIMARKFGGKVEFIKCLLQRYTDVTMVS